MANHCHQYCLCYTNKMISIQNLMTSKVITVSPDAPILQAAQILVEHNFHGLPVVDQNNKLVGLVTEYNLINEKSLLHLPTLQSVLKSLPVFSKSVLR